jgi:arylsulfatase A-like enzyme
MKPRAFAAGCLALLTLAVAAPRAQPQRPNIVFILADDLGYADVGFSGGRQIATPRIDQLAASGARLEHFYVQPVCSPTRAAFLTGRYPMRHGLQVGVVRPWAQYGLPLAERTLAQALKEAGYATAIVGKWHLGHFEPAYLPTRRGFDVQYGPYNGAIDYVTHDRDGGLDWHRQDRASHDEGYSTHLLAREAVSFIDTHKSGAPFFLYLAFNAVHAPLMAPDAYKAPYAKLAEPRRTYAGMLAAMDEAIGQIVDVLDRNGLRDNTLVVFSSDNGGPAPGTVTDNTPFRAQKGTLYEGGVRAAACVSWPGRVKPGGSVVQPLHIVDWYPTLLKLARAKLEQQLPIDGRDAWPTIAAGRPSPHAEILINAAPMSGAIRAGNWKLVLNGVGHEAEVRVRERGGAIPPEAPKIELFDLAADPGERRNLADSHPERVRDLRARYDALARQAVPPLLKPRDPGFTTPKVWGEKGS